MVAGEERSGKVANRTAEQYLESFCSLRFAQPVTQFFLENYLLRGGPTGLAYTSQAGFVVFRVDGQLRLRSR